MINVRLVWFASILSAFVLTAAAAPSRNAKQSVAIIFDGGNPGSHDAGINQVFNSTVSDGMGTFEAAGINRVIVLRRSGSRNRQPTAQNLERILKSLKNVSNLQIQFVAHGLAIPVAKFQSSYVSYSARNNQKALNQRFAAIPLTRTESKFATKAFNSLGVLRNYAHFSGELPTQTRFFVYTASDEKGLPNSDPKQSKDVGMGDLKEALARFRRSNPTAVTTIYSNSCFSGALARGLANTPRVQTFVASQPVMYAEASTPQIAKRADLYHPSAYTSYSVYLLDRLRRGQSYSTAHDQAVQEYLDFFDKVPDPALDTADYLAVPTDSAQQFVLNWCMTKHAYISRKKMCVNQIAFNSVQKTDSIADRFFKNDAQIKGCNQNAYTIQQLNNVKKLLLKRVFENAFSKMKRPYNYKVVFRHELTEEQKLYYESLNRWPDQTKRILQSWKRLGKLTSAGQQKYVKRIHASDLKTLRAAYRTCILNKPDFWWDASCARSDLLSGLFINIQRSWARDPYSHLRKQDSNHCNLKNLTVTRRNLLDGARCIERLSKTDPIAALSLSVTAPDSIFFRYGKVCPLARLAAKMAYGNRQCLLRFRNEASCYDWHRLTDLVDMGSQHLVNVNRMYQRNRSTR